MLVYSDTGVQFTATVTVTDLLLGWDLENGVVLAGIAFSLLMVVVPTCSYSLVGCTKDCVYDRRSALQNEPSDAVYLCTTATRPVVLRHCLLQVDAVC